MASCCPAASRRPMSRRSALRLFGAAALGALGLCTLGGCSSTDVDVYVPVSVTTRSADDLDVVVETRTLDDRGNAIGTQVEELKGSWTLTETFDAFGIPAAQEGNTREVTYDDKGQPTSIVERNAGGVAVETWRYAYYDVQGRVAELAFAGPDYAFTMTFGRDGWPLSGSVTAHAVEHPVAFVYEIDLNGAVTRQNICFDGASEPALWYTYTYDDNNLVAERVAWDGTTTSYTYELVENPTPYAMAQALLHAPDYGALVEAASE